MIQTKHIRHRTNTLFLLAEELKRFKKEKGLKDFNDLLEDFY